MKKRADTNANPQARRRRLDQLVGGIGNDRLFSIEVTDKPKWFQFRRRISRALVWCAKLIYPQSPEVATFMYEVTVEQAIAGSVVIRQATGEVIYPANPSHHDGAASAPSVDGVVGSLN